MKKAPNSWFRRIGHSPKGMTVAAYDAASLSDKSKTMVAMATYHLAIRRTVYILIHFLVMVMSLMFTILGLVNDPLMNDAYSFVPIVVFIVSLVLGFITMIIVKNMIGGFRFIGGGNLLSLSGLTKFLMAFAYGIATVWGFIAQLIMLLTAGSTTVSSAIRLYVPEGDLEDAYNRYTKEFQ